MQGAMHGIKPRTTGFSYHPPMSSIATKHGDAGTTGLIGGQRTSKADPRVESYGDVDELNSTLGFARSICGQADIREWTEQIQKDALPGRRRARHAPRETAGKTRSSPRADVDRLTGLVEQIEATPGILSDWSLPGAHTQSAAYEDRAGHLPARRTCRRPPRRTSPRGRKLGASRGARLPQSPL